MDGFFTRWRERARCTSHLAVGLGPSLERLRWWNLPDTLAGAERHSRQIVEVAAPEVSLLKIQTPFFERFGPAGLDLLRLVVDDAHAFGTPVVLDAKRGDAADVMEVLSDIYLGPDSVLGGDAVTLAPYLGLEAMDPLLAAVARLGCGALVMVRTSNHRSGDVQLARTAAGTTVSQSLASALGAWNREHDLRCLGGVIGASGGEAADLVERLADGLVSLPGLGREGRGVAQVVAGAGAHVERAVFPVTGGLLRHEPGPRLRSALRFWTEQVRAACEHASSVPERKTS
jgi:orotidine-5'-phosphate decarboxylase